MMSYILAAFSADSSHSRSYNTWMSPKVHKFLDTYWIMYPSKRFIMLPRYPVPFKTKVRPAHPFHFFMSRADTSAPNCYSFSYSYKCGRQTGKQTESESIEWIIEGYAFPRSYDLPPRPPPPPFSRHKARHTGDTQEDCERETTCWRERREGIGEEPKRIIRPPESLVI